MRIPVVEVIAGTTLRATWVNSGVIPTTLTSALRTGSETVVSSVTAISSGSGFFFSLHPVPLAGDWYINEWVAIIASNTYVDRQLVRVAHLEVD